MEIYAKQSVFQKMYFEMVLKVYFLIVLYFLLETVVSNSYKHLSFWSYLTVIGLGETCLFILLQVLA